MVTGVQTCALPILLGKPAVPRRLSDLQVAAHLVEFLAGGEEFVALGELADDLVRRMPPAFRRCHVVADSSCPNIRTTESHNNWTTTRGSPHVPEALAALATFDNAAVPAKAKDSELQEAISPVEQPFRTAVRSGYDLGTATNRPQALW